MLKEVKNYIDGRLAQRVLSREEMEFPPNWVEAQQVVYYRYGELKDGTIGYQRFVNPSQGLEHV